MNCTSCNSTNTKSNGSRKSVQRYLCKDCGKSFSEGDRAVGRPKRADGLTRQQAWYQSNKERMLKRQREKRAEKKDQGDV